MTEKKMDSSKKKLTKISVYCTEQFKKELEEYMMINGYRSKSSLLKMAFRTHKMIYSNAKSQEQNVSLEERLIMIQNKLDSIEKEKKLLEEQDCWTPCKIHYIF